MQRVAAYLMLGPSSVGFFATTAAGCAWLPNWWAFAYYWAFLICPFLTAIGLWHRYHPNSRFRRPLDMAVTGACISTQTYHAVTHCRCATHQAAYLAVAASGVVLYAAGWYVVRRWHASLLVHLSTHFAAYVATALLFSCVAIESTATT